ncbi:hypothetical protein PTSG_02578 [Salpingoeca rosetta]|uniref:VPS9 domain-containing protein n=1 Tax=Salpingoeca rosetta (strain ATCC 50818 / BSB-021) TaxID=946362 RepID=F2U2P8_SALR5|nr:uncharacterized protein PTSG_02578 [Salpingoeca rosetta]EGD81892.1 hypothetical protein PTSG_02578 [Salpingoeca rosetta]|eukprot:XP_004996075.1 hypothetical protein PTSG_02578 [Salpingoeca rosetta]
MADDDADRLLDVDHNDLFRALQTNLHKVWQQAQENCWVVCIPRPSISNNIRLTKDIVRRHVLRPSPVYKGQYLTLGSKPHKFEIKGNQLVSLDGDAPIRIIHEEAFYNENFEPFKVYCIDNAIGNVTYTKANEGSDLLQLKRLPSGRAYVEWLDANVDAEKMLQCRRLVRAFNMEYLTAKGYVHYVREKVSSLWTDVLMKVQGSRRGRGSTHTSTDVTQFWEEAAECFVLVESHRKLHGVYVREWETHAAVLRSAFHRYQTDPAPLDVSRAFEPLDLTQAVAALATLPGRHCRLDKDAALQEVLDLISAAAELHNVTTGAKLVLASDDLIPLLSKCVLLSRKDSLFAELAYMKEMRLSDTNDTSQAHFNLVTLEAALTNAVQSFGLQLPAISGVGDTPVAAEHTRGGGTGGGGGGDGSGVHSALSGGRGRRGDGGVSGSNAGMSQQQDLVSGAPVQGGDGGDGRRGSGGNNEQKQIQRQRGGDGSVHGNGDGGDTQASTGKTTAKTNTTAAPAEVVVLPELQSRVRTTDGQAPRVGGLLSRLSQFNF